MTCRVCGASGEFPTLQAREMMLGLRDKHLYFQCNSCGCLQIEAPPTDMGRYYPSSYYSFAPQPLRRRSRLGIAHALLFRPPWLPWLKTAGVWTQDRILDIGAGSGSFLRELYHVGFEHLTGIEPFLNEDLSYAPGFKVLKQSLNEHQGEYDFISSQHSLEHMPDQLDALKHIHRLLAPGRTALVRIPLCDSAPFEEYRENWVQLDAPRHFFLHTRKSFGMLAEQAGLKITHVGYDSNEFSFWGSEQYKADMPLQDPRSWGVNRRLSVFSRGDVIKFRKRAKSLNREGRGDSACFFLRKD